MRLVSSDLVAGPLDIAQDALRALEQPLTAFGQPHAAVGAGEQGDVELVLEPLDMPGESRLGDADKIVKAAQFHRAAISLALAAEVNRNSRAVSHAEAAWP